MKYVLAATAIGITGPLLAETEQNYPVSELYVMTMEQAQLQNEVLTLTGMNSKVIWFTDRPERQSGVAYTDAFIANWPMGDDDFEVDPPNAVLVGENADGEEFEIAMELMNPEWNQDILTLRVLPLGEALPDKLGLSAAHLFIDNSSDDGDVGSWCGHECFRPVIQD